MTLVACRGCGVAYPEALLAPFVERGTTLALCGICALAHLNAEHGTHYLTFHNARAEEKRQQAVAWRETKRV